MVEVTKPMGSYHIIDGEKVSLRYRGQIRTCARCHHTEKECSGKGVARDCKEDRVLLSNHMEKHWRDIGFIPDSNSTADIEEEEFEIQIGKEKIEEKNSKGPDLTHRYSSIIVSGFNSDQMLADIHEVLISQGLPSSIKFEDLIQNGKTGKITIDELSPTDCLSLMENMHGKKFLGKKVYITSVVSASPVKSAPHAAARATSGPPPPPPPPPQPSPQVFNIKHKITTILTPTCTNISLVPVVIIESVEDNLPGLDSSSGSGSDSDSDSEPNPSPRSATFQAKIDVFDSAAAQSSNFFRKTSISEKRKAIESPEKSDLTKAEKRSLKKERKRLRKLEHQHKEQGNFMLGHGN
jgi:hypothetical protein